MPITNVTATMAPLISFIAFCVASKGSKPSWAIFTLTASITTMASSTTIPIAITKAKSDIMLSVIPKAFMTAKLPINETGTARHGMRAERQSPRNKNTTKPTSIKGFKQRSEYLFYRGIKESTDVVTQTHNACPLACLFEDEP